MPHPDNIGTQKDLILYRIETAKEDLKSAMLLRDANIYKGANNRAYYAVFHAITAIHGLKGVAYKRHKDAIANFNKEYVKTGIFPREIGRKIAGVEEIRHASDYDDFYITTLDEVDEQIATAEEFIGLVEDYCHQHMDDI
ncbi:MAG: HEPN domain-containing protein [Blautia sp.]|nr:HEPN domain-containing protein [Blautia sp.]